jgi:leader peptidase (prepilin peptidase)/N-methyltransferase
MTSIHFYLAAHPVAFIALALVLGLIVGSFLNVVILRLPVMLERRWRSQAQEPLHPARAATKPEGPFDLIRPNSHCPHCGNRIRAWENIPVLSFLWLRGKCSACRKSISWRYPLVELTTGLLSALVAWRFGYGLAAGAGLLFTWALIALTFIDYDTQLLPDDITLPLLWIGLFINLSTLLTPLSSAVIGAAAGYAFLWLVYQAFKLLTGKEGMGFGDFKLFAALGAWLGWLQLPLILLLSSFLGAIVGIAFIVFFGRDRQLPIPFGPFLCAAGWIAFMWGEEITRYYLQLARF